MWQKFLCSKTFSSLSLFRQIVTIIEIIVLAANLRLKILIFLFFKTKKKKVKVIFSSKGRHKLNVTPLIAIFQKCIVLQHQKSLKKAQKSFTDYLMTMCQVFDETKTFKRFKNPQFKILETEFWFSLEWGNTLKGQ